MVTLDQVMERLLEVCPDFRPHYEEYLRSFYDPEEVPEPTPYTDVSAFNVYLLDALKTGRMTCFASCFAFAEHLLETGDESIKNWVVVGFFEGLQNQVSHTSLGYDVFLSWLGLKSREAWAELIRGWDG